MQPFLIAHYAQNSINFHDVRFCVILFTMDLNEIITTFGCVVEGRGILNLFFLFAS